jgi:hypothetical protein
MMGNGSISESKCRVLEGRCLSESDILMPDGGHLLIYHRSSLCISLQEHDRTLVDNMLRGRPYQIDF